MLSKTLYVTMRRYRIVKHDVYTGVSNPVNVSSCIESSWAMCQIDEQMYCMEK